MELFILFTLILLNGLFAMAEIGLVTARKARLSSRAGNGDKAAQAAIRLGEDPARFLSAVQIGITSIGLCSGIVGEAALAAPLADWLMTQFSISPGTASTLSTVLTVSAVTYFSIVIGELVPKRIGQLNPEKTACLAALPMEGLASLSRPFVALLTGSTSLVLRLLGLRPDTRQHITEEDLQAMIAESSEAGEIEHSQHKMLRNIFQLDDRPAANIMIPRGDIHFLDTALSAEDNLAVLKQYEHSWLPVCHGGLGGLFGVIRTTRALLLFSETPPSDFSSELVSQCEKPTFVPETLNTLELLEHFQQTGTHLLFIVDEYGTLEGLATAHDLLSLLVGQTCPPHLNGCAVPRADGSWLMDGGIPILDLKERLGLRQLPDEDRGHYSILSGMLMYMAGRVPHEGDCMEWEDWRFEIVDMDGNMIDKVLVKKKHP